MEAMSAGLGIIAILAEVSTSICKVHNEVHESHKAINFFKATLKCTKDTLRDIIDAVNEPPDGSEFSLCKEQTKYTRLVKVLEPTACRLKTIRLRYRCEEGEKLTWLSRWVWVSFRKQEAEELIKKMMRWHVLVQSALGISNGRHAAAERRRLAASEKPQGQGVWEACINIRRMQASVRLIESPRNSLGFVAIQLQHNLPNINLFVEFIMQWTEAIDIPSLADPNELLPPPTPENEVAESKPPQYQPLDRTAPPRISINILALAITLEILQNYMDIFDLNDATTESVDKLNTILNQPVDPRISEWLEPMEDTGTEVSRYSLSDASSEKGKSLSESTMRWQKGRQNRASREETT